MFYWPGKCSEVLSWNGIADMPAIMRFLARPEAHTKNRRMRLCSRGEELGKA